MATILTGSKQIIYQEDVDFNSTNSEALQTKIAKAALFSQDTAEYVARFSYVGFFRNTGISTGAQRFVVTKRSEIKRYVLSIGKTGISTASAMNIKIYDEDGAFVNDLFSSTFEPSILAGTTRNNVYVGYNESESSNIEGNITGLTINNGTTNLQILEEGYQLVAEIISNGVGAKNIDLALILQRIE